MEPDNLDHLKEVLACPVCKGTLNYHKEKSVFSCRSCRLYFPVRNGIPVLLLEKAEHFDE
ncbi:MAG: Trm112 family protein [FCB group bacterium]|nr:Trm112 family protein [FCB group bacterium]